MQAHEAARITNGGTGVHTPPAPMAAASPTVEETRSRAHAAALADMHARHAASAMGHARWSSGVGPAPERHPSWGTPD